MTNFIYDRVPNFNTHEDAVKQLATLFTVLLICKITFEVTEIGEDSTWSTTLGSRLALLTALADVGSSGLRDVALDRLVLDAGPCPFMKDRQTVRTYAACTDTDIPFIKAYICIQ